MLCKRRCIRNIHLQHWCRLFAIEWNESRGNAALKLKRSFSIKTLIDEYKLTRFSFKRLDDDSLCLYNVWGKEQLATPPSSPSRIQEGRSILEREIQNSPNLSPTVIKPFMYPWGKWSLQKEVHILLPTYPSPFPSSTHTHACVKPLIHPWVEVKFVYPANDSRSGDKFPKKLWCCVGGGYNKMIWFYQLNWKCELATVKVSKEDTLSVSTRGLTFQMLA